MNPWTNTTQLRKSFETASAEQEEAKMKKIQAEEHERKRKNFMILEKQKKESKVIRD